MMTLVGRLSPCVHQMRCRIPAAVPSDTIVKPAATTTPASVTAGAARSIESAARQVQQPQQSPKSQHQQSQQQHVQMKRPRPRRPLLHGLAPGLAQANTPLSRPGSQPVSIASAGSGTVAPCAPAALFTGSSNNSTSGNAPPGNLMESHSSAAADSLAGKSPVQPEPAAKSNDSSSASLPLQKNDANCRTSSIAASQDRQQLGDNFPIVDKEYYMEQRSDAWYQIREGRLTASSLINLLGWFNFWNKGSAPDQIRLWRSLAGIERETLSEAANPAVAYGILMEHRARQAYQGLVPYEHVSKPPSFVLWDTDVEHSWLGASPDSFTSIVLEPLNNDQQGSTTAAVGGGSEASARKSRQLMQGTPLSDWLQKQKGLSCDGILEIKCPHKYSPDRVGSKKTIERPAHYMMQIQTQLEVVDREWAVMYNWTETIGSCMILIHRDRSYFALLLQVMEHFYWQHVAPAKKELDLYDVNHPDRAAVIQRLQAKHEPLLAAPHPVAQQIRKLSEAMVRNAPARRFTKEETDLAGSLGKLMLPDKAEA